MISCVIQDQKGPAKFQVNNISSSYHKKFSTLHHSIDSFTKYYTYKIEMANWEVQQSAVNQPNVITNEEGCYWVHPVVAASTSH